jgi:hypothetical protein
MLWTPGAENTVAAAMERTGTTMGGYVGGSLFREFQPDLVSLVSRAFGRSKPKQGSKP